MGRPAEEGPQISAAQLQEMFSALQAIGPLREEMNALKAELKAREEREEANALKVLRAQEEINALKANATEEKARQELDISPLRERISALEAASPPRDRRSPPTVAVAISGVSRTPQEAPRVSNASAGATAVPAAPSPQQQA
eukprot:gene22076-49410_t